MLCSHRDNIVLEGNKKAVPSSDIVVCLANGIRWYVELLNEDDPFTSVKMITPNLT